jgi:hypothetical protein
MLSATIGPPIHGPDKVGSKVWETKSWETNESKIGISLDQGAGTSLYLSLSNFDDNSSNEPAVSDADVLSHPHAVKGTVITNDYEPFVACPKASFASDDDEAFERKSLQDYNEESLASAASTPKNHDSKLDLAGIRDIDLDDSKKHVQFFLSPEQEEREALRTPWIGSERCCRPPHATSTNGREWARATAPSFVTLIWRSMSRKLPCVALAAMVKNVD